jgi:hypothetical protein
MPHTALNRGAQSSFRHLIFAKFAFFVIISFGFQRISVMMTFMKHFRGLSLLLVIVLLAAVPAVAQTATPAAPAPSLREIYIALSMGDPVFEPEVWLASAAERDDRTTATWISAQDGALGYAEYLHFDEGYEPANLSAFFDDEWFAVSFKEYDDWERAARCTVGDVLLHEFRLTKSDQPYVMRYWIQPVTPTRVLTLHMVFPDDRVALLDEYSQRYAPLAWRCPR